MFFDSRDLEIRRKSPIKTIPYCKSEVSTVYRYSMLF